MKNIFRVFALTLLLALTTVAAMAQNVKWQDLYKVKKKDTLYGITKKYGITLEELMAANPFINTADYKLKKGDQLLIPFHKEPQKPAPAPQKPASKLTKGTVHVGVMLPLHNIDGDGRRMTEYYRGLLMACDSLRRQGLTIDMHAWNVAIDDDIRQTLLDESASKCDIIFGPLYTKQVKPLGDFCRKHDIRMVIPFSINGNEVKTNPRIFQVYQSPETLSQRAVSAFLERFPRHHVVFIDCNDTTSKKGMFTFQLRKRLEEKGRIYNITNLKSSEAYFAKAFSKTEPNVVVLNTGRSPELNVAFAKLNTLTARYPKVSVALFGYTEWMLYTKYDLDNFYKYNVHIPATFYTNPLSAKTARAEQKFRWNFHADMQQALPRFALTGFDQAYFFIKGLKTRGKAFNGAKGTVAYTPIQTPLRFERAAEGGGYKNRSMLFVHYTPGRRVEVINF